MPDIPRVTDCHLFPADFVHRGTFLSHRFFLRLQIQMTKITNRVTLRLEKAKVTALPWSTIPFVLWWRRICTACGMQRRREEKRREEKRGRNCRRVANRALRAGQLNKKLNLKEAESRRREGGEKVERRKGMEGEHNVAHCRIASGAWPPATP